MKEKNIIETIKGRVVSYTVKFYSRARYYYLNMLDNKPIPDTDPFPCKQAVRDFVEAYNLTNDMKKSLSVGFRPQGMNIEQFLKERQP